MQDEDKVFREQIKEDLELIKENVSWDSNITKNEYAFNYWVLSNIYNLDIENAYNNITEYNDKGIDCFVHYEENKELYIIQNKYYGEDTKLNSKEVSDFLTRPITALEKNKYKKHPELQEIYNKHSKDTEYKIFLNFYVTNNCEDNTIYDLINEYNKNNDTFAKLFSLADIRDKYYGKSYSEGSKLPAVINVKNKATYLAIRPKQYNLPNMSEAYYVMAKVYDIYKLWEQAEKDNYPLFEENIREYLGGTSGINKAIIMTLKDTEARSNFFYYNNGITIICDEAKADSHTVKMENPQVVNGCQTVNSIAEVLKHDIDGENNFKDVYVIAKILVLDRKDQDFYRKIVKYTNSQNSINEKAFGATLKPFFKIQKKIKEQGFLLIVKQSDKHTFKEDYKEKKDKGKLLELANKASNKNFHEFKNITDVQISLETLIQIIGAFNEDACFAYQKKPLLLKKNSKEYQEFSTKIGDFYTTDNMIKLIVLYKKSEHDKRRSEDKKTSITYYLLNFLGYYLKNREINKRKFLKKLKPDELSFVYDKFKSLPTKYYKEWTKKHDLDYGIMIKREVDIDIMEEALENHFSGLKEHNKSEYDKLESIFSV